MTVDGTSLYEFTGSGGGCDFLVENVGGIN